MSANPFSGRDKKPLALIAGATASGKTALALEIAKRRAVTIINADSAQVYRELPILSAQPTAQEQASCPHRLFGYRDGSEACSAADWAEDAKRAIAEAWEAGRLPMLVGGTGLYMRTLLDGIAPIPEIDPAIRADVRAADTETVYRDLAREDPSMADRLSPNDRSRLQRALEVIRSTGRSIADWRRETTGGIGEEVALNAHVLLPDREWLYERCDRRFATMVDKGAIGEVEALLALDLPDDAPVLRAIGVPELREYLGGRLSLAEAIAKGATATRQYAKRQYTWFRNQPPANWHRHSNIDYSNIINYFET